MLSSSNAQVGLVDFSMVDVLLVSNCFSMLALPFLTSVANHRPRLQATTIREWPGGEAAQTASYEMINVHLLTAEAWIHWEDLRH